MFSETPRVVYLRKKEQHEQHPHGHAIIDTPSMGHRFEPISRPISCAWSVQPARFGWRWHFRRPRSRGSVRILTKSSTVKRLGTGSNRTKKQKQLQTGTSATVLPLPCAALRCPILDHSIQVRSDHDSICTKQALPWQARPAETQARPVTKLA
ncbi:hypothetical protein VTN77DRAFT_5703 [Rasamsonia byssochlamydoides]|uniref:uncharacterized protein n=1 Tax=Rasamsonia byssochlamydoides TaxID=89139 RepID=UPI0037433998